MNDWVKNTLFVIGLILIAYGVFLIWKPLLFLFSGLILVVLSLAVQWNQMKTTERRSDVS